MSGRGIDAPCGSGFSRELPRHAIRLSAMPLQFPFAPGSLAAILTFPPSVEDKAAACDAVVGRDGIVPAAAPIRDPYE